MLPMIIHNQPFHPLQTGKKQPESSLKKLKRDINFHTEDNECKFPENYNLIKKQATKQKYPFILSNFTDSNILEVLSP